MGTHSIVFYTEDNSLLIERSRDLKITDPDSTVLKIGTKIKKTFQVEDISDEGLPELVSKEYGGFVVFSGEGKRFLRMIWKFSEDHVSYIFFNF